MSSRRVVIVSSLSQMTCQSSKKVVCLMLYQHLPGSRVRAQVDLEMQHEPWVEFCFSLCVHLFLQKMVVLSVKSVIRVDWVPIVLPGRRTSGQSAPARQDQLLPCLSPTGLSNVFY